MGDVFAFLDLNHDLFASFKSVCKGGESGADTEREAD